jgi:signal transduction histidine kinase
MSDFSNTDRLEFLPSKALDTAISDNIFTTIGQIGLRGRMMIAFVSLSFISVGILAYWLYQSALEKEFTAVEEKHLIVAQNLSDGLSRYVGDVRRTFSHLVAIQDVEQLKGVIAETLLGFNLRYLAVFDSTGKLVRQIMASGEFDIPLPDQNKLQELKNRAIENPGRVMISGIQPFDGAPHFFVVSALADGKLAVALLKPDHVIATQKSIAFGERGHSMVVDQFGHVIAHPNAKWQASSKDASRLSVVKLMMQGKTGVAKFYSPPMKADMVAGYTSVSETGWGIMVPQPQQELTDNVANITRQAIFVALASIVTSCLLGWFVSRHLTQPISAVTAAAERQRAGEHDVRVDKMGVYAPPEIRELAATFNSMVDELAENNLHLVTALEKSEAGNRAKQSFLKMMTHEIRTPMNGIIGILDLMKDSSLDELQREYISAANLSALGLMKILSDFLEIAKADSKKIVPNNLPFSPSSLVSEARNMFAQEAASKNVVLENCLSDDMPESLLGDAALLRPVIFNLVGNAIKFTKQGKVSVDLAYSPIDGHAGTLTITVKDSGIGIAPEHQSKVFDEFFQGESSYNRRYEGLGLGLSICQRLVGLMSGAITLKSEPGKGSTFIVHVPSNRVTS